MPFQQKANTWLGSEERAGWVIHACPREGGALGMGRCPNPLRPTLSREGVEWAISWPGLLLLHTLSLSYWCKLEFFFGNSPGRPPNLRGSEVAPLSPLSSMCVSTSGSRLYGSTGCPFEGLGGRRWGFSIWVGHSQHSHFPLYIHWWYWPLMTASVLSHMPSKVGNKAEGVWGRIERTDSRTFYVHEPHVPTWITAQLIFKTHHWLIVYLLRESPHPHTHFLKT